jgi:hypothetical protein
VRSAWTNFGEGGWNRARGCGQTEGGSYVLRSVYKKSSFCAFCVDQLLGRVLDGCHGRGRERRGVRAVESWNGETASCAF